MQRCHVQTTYSSTKIFDMSALFAFVEAGAEKTFCELKAAKAFEADEQDESCHDFVQSRRPQNIRPIRLSARR
jgi:hypothetical protein